ncbi:MAG TPA: hypothetical protein PLJ04_01335 [Candidatus Saccharibacteria bacterium]|nr:hypothetical protein [Candidatus Saccharibacteria bacterium]MCB9817053.1 hypothetical protein [Candidatus Nomurabacteria bacterium]HPR10201.1 hypothetical protein [Candidatus Saccharibacteria bacterium]
MKKFDTVYVLALTLFVAGVVIVAMLIPFKQMRQAALDSTMSSALTEVAQEIKAFVQKNNKLPEDVNALEFKGEMSVVNNNPAILGQITYQKDSSNSKEMQFSLCANFKTENKSSESSPLPTALMGQSLSPQSYSSVDYKNHPAGYHCFEKETISSANSYDSYFESLYNNQSPQDTTQPMIDPYNFN